MSLNRAYLGRTYPAPRTYEVGREKIREFADAIGDDNPAFRDPEAARAVGLPDVVAPPTFLFAVTMPWSAALVTDPDVGVDYSRLVHGEQSFVHYRPVHPGDRLTGTVTIDDMEIKGRNELMTYRTEVSTEAGERVATLRTTFVIRGTAPAAEPAAAPAGGA